MQPRSQRPLSFFHFGTARRISLRPEKREGAGNEGGSYVLTTGLKKASQIRLIPWKTVFLAFIQKSALNL